MEGEGSGEEGGGRGSGEHVVDIRRTVVMPCLALTR